MRRLIMVILAVVLLVLMSSHTKAEMHPYAKVDWLGSYVFSNGFVASPRPVFQPETGIIFDNGFDMSLWASLPASMNRVDEDSATEIDLCLGYSFGMFRVGASYFFMSPMGKLRNDIIQVNAQVEKKFEFGKFSISPKLAMEYNLPADGMINKDTTGFYVYPSVGFSYKATDFITVALNNKFAIDLGGYGADKAVVAKISPNFSYQLTKALSVNAGIDMYFPIAKSGKDERREQYVPRFGASYNF